jgi:drug/metabolite transporter (DMT)-like permease
VALWVWLSLGAAFFQNLRSALQKELSRRHGVVGATFARFLYAAPLACLAVAVIAFTGGPLPRPTPGFLAAVVIGGVSQVAATLMLVRLFSLRNFAVGNTFAKTDTVQAAIIGALLLGDTLGPGPVAAILVSLIGILLLSGPVGFTQGILHRSATLGLGAGLGFAASGVAYRAAALALEGEAGSFMRAAVALAAVTLFQTLTMGGWLLLRRPETVGGLLRDWRRAGLVGVAGMLASLGWFTALALQPAALVKAVGQVELILSYVTGRAVFGERPGLREVLGILLVASGIVALVLTA